MNMKRATMLHPLPNSGASLAFDGLIAADGRLLMAARYGKLLCYR